VEPGPDQCLDVFSFVYVLATSVSHLTSVVLHWLMDKSRQVTLGLELVANDTKKLIQTIAKDFVTQNNRVSWRAIICSHKDLLI